MHVYCNFLISDCEWTVENKKKTSLNAIILETDLERFIYVFKQCIQEITQ